MAVSGYPLITTAQSESELAAVLSHEIAHVTQRHIARLFQQQKQAGMASLAALALAILAARSSPDLASAAMAGAQYATIQTQLNFTRDNEREADRIGVQILERAGFDPAAMPVFLDRMQRAYRVYESNAPSYMRTHPLTYERIADVQSRVDALAYRQVPDSLDFQFVRTRLVVLAGSPRDSIQHYEHILAEKKTVHEAAARYGLTMALLRAKDTNRALTEARRLQDEAPDNAMAQALVARVLLASAKRKEAFALYDEAIASHPGRRGLIYDYADALLDAGRVEDALSLVARTQQRLPPDYRLYQLEARAHQSLGQRLQQHRAQAEAYLLRGSVPAAIEQLQLGLRSGDGDYFQLSSAEARLKELQALASNAQRRN